MSEATSQITALCSRAKLIISQCKDEKNWTDISLVISMLQRGVNHPSTNVSSAAPRAEANLLLIEALIIDLKYRQTEESRFILTQQVINYAALSRPAFEAAIRLSKNAASDKFNNQWRVHARDCYQEYITTAIECISRMETSQVELFQGDVPVEVAAKAMSTRVAAMNVFQTALGDTSLRTVCRLTYFKADQLLKASVLEMEGVSQGNTAGASSAQQAGKTIVDQLRSSTRLAHAGDSLMVEIIDILERLERAGAEPPHSRDEIQSLQDQVYYQCCATAAAKQIRIAMAIMSDDEGIGPSSTDRVEKAVDLLREAIVLAREVALPQEAEATARLALMYHSVPSIKSVDKAENLYEAAFSLIQTVNMNSTISWVSDVRRKRVMIQRRRAEQADADRIPILEKNAELLEKLRNAVAEQLYSGNESILKVYELYPARGNVTKPDKIADGQLKSIMKKMLHHYHPDKNGREAYGTEHAVICEEITKAINLRYATFFKSE